MFFKAASVALVLAATTTSANASMAEAILNMFDGGNDISAALGPATAKKNPVGSNRPPASFSGQWYTAPNGCSYSRAQAPGYPPSWHLILNPHHIGGKPAHSGCASML
ncbi:hypothetical protein [Aestuariivita sp.]|jgi:hypothetical protein|uniref:hypothetical protein n=1 Tax=Aestuariivita sp. TaxID=1872407 RepID=UPI0021730E0D|nr:hypothetical protein [Aestuariivita sp.]MCE8006538.1 hypothetical protein [Aestuariivita sp.]